MFSEKICLHLLENFKGCGHRIYFDNYFSSLNLINELLNKKIYCTGIIKESRKDLPKFIKDVHLNKNEIICFKNIKRNIYLFKYLDRRMIYLISSDYYDINDNLLKLKNKKKIPNIIALYNKGKSVVDLLDQMNKYNNSLRRSRKWYRKLAFSLLLGDCISNSFLIFKIKNKININITDFKKMIIQELFKEKSKLFVMKHFLIIDITLKKKKNCIKCYKINNNKYGREYALNHLKKIKTKCSVCIGYCCENCWINDHINKY